jgi:toxin ParE1/3/4
VKITWAKRATRHLRSAYEFWRQERSEAAAELMLKRIFSVVELLEQHPQMGRTGRIEGTRELVLKPLPFLLAYRVRRNKIEIIAVLHGARKWPDRL